jgi:hypothetical protein
MCFAALNTIRFTPVTLISAIFEVRYAEKDPNSICLPR